MKRKRARAKYDLEPWMEVMGTIRSAFEEAVRYGDIRLAARYARHWARISADVLRLARSLRREYARRNPEKPGKVPLETLECQFILLAREGDAAVAALERTRMKSARARRAAVRATKDTVEIVRFMARFLRDEAVKRGRWSEAYASALDLGRWL